jgi:hypothetical protein
MEEQCRFELWKMEMNLLLEEKDKWEDEKKALMEEKKRLHYTWLDLLKAGDKNKEKMKRIWQICDERDLLIITSCSCCNINLLYETIECFR